jgi:site-specific DNA-methyltransferase (adenine-specific)
MKKYQIEVKGLKLEIVQDNDGKFVTPDIVKEYEKVGSAVKPSFEPIIVARKPFKGSLVDNVIEYGVGGINIDECRVEYANKKDKEFHKKEIDRVLRVNTPFNNSWKNCSNLNNANPQNEQGRFPANTILTYDETDFDEVCGGFPNTKSKKTKNDNRKNKGNSMFIDGVHNELNSYNDSGSASRYFYCAKASKKDRDEGLDEFEEIDGGSYQFRQDGSLDGKIPVRKNTHPTVKPTTLMQYLVRLVTPNGGTVLDPFNGSGSTGKAVMYENKERNKNYKYIGIELTEEYLPIAKDRIEYVCNLKEEIKERQTSLFDE